MTKSKLEERVAELEKQFKKLLADLEGISQQKDWRHTFGAFTGDEVMKQIFEEGAKIREADRRRAKRRAPTKRPTHL